MPLYAGVVIEDAPLSTVYHYAVPLPLRSRVEVGVRVGVPFGRRRTHGFVVETANTAPIEESRIKPLREVTGDGALATPEIVSLAKWIAEYYHCGWGEVLAAAVPVAVRKGIREKTLLHVELAVPPEAAREAIQARSRRAPKQAAALEALLAVERPIGFADIEQRTGASRVAVKALERDGLVTVSALPVHHELGRVAEPVGELTLTPGQAAALDAIAETVEAHDFAVHLLHGATASGKTEVYLRALEATLRQGRTAIVLVPEISLTPQTVERFRDRVGEVAVLHSRMAAGARAEEWRRLRSGEVRVAIGARSAIFSPLPDLGLIVVDEEHERTFKQDSAPRYHARDVAVVRARACGATVVLGSATPSLESYRNAREGRYRLLELPERVGDGTPPSVEIVDMRAEWDDLKRQTLVSRKLDAAITDRLRRGEQIILFLNRRGFHTWVHCLHCTEVLRCPRCDISLTFHQRDNALACHYCEYTTPVPAVCPDCGAARLRFAGSGTERVEETVGELYPDARLLRMDADTMTGRDAHADALGAFARGEYDILLGTQMVTKGHDFPNVTLIGVLFADGSINLPDFRAAEHTFQLVMQVIGRAGRGARPGLGIVQAFDPSHYAVTLAAQQDYPAFVARELADRQGLGYPPFGRLARVLVRGPDRDKVEALAAEAAEALRAVSDPMSVLGPAPCPIERIQRLWRHHLLLKTPDAGARARALRRAADTLVDRGKTKLVIDIDPVSLL